MKIQINNLTRSFKDVLAVDNLSVEIGDGELVTFLGPSGCGKSTTLFMLAGIFNQDSGDIYFDNILVNGIDTEKRNIGMVFQNYALYPHMTVRKNILFPLKMMNVPKNESIRRVNEIAELLKIGELLDRKPAQLSGGQQQRVAIGRALVKKPSVLLMDEPLSNLDAKLRIETREEIKKLQQELGITTIFVTHDQDEAASISDRILLMENGKLQQYDKPRVIYNNPSNLFTAKFIGHTPINIFDLIVKDGQACIKGTSININNKTIKNLNSLDEIVGTIRPEDVLLCSDSEMDFSSVVEQLDMIGKDNMVIFYLGEYKFRAYVPAEYNITVGNRMSFKFRKENLHFFHKDNGVNIIRIDR